jgi:post-segregation antitoxin (ccd killing protein)
VLDAQFFGYSLIALGDLVNDEFPKLTTIRRFNISPDRLNVTSYVYSLSGAQFMEEPYHQWNVWTPTATEVGISLCGYGLLYKVAMYEIICRNTLGFNTDAAELYGMPIRMGKTSKTNEDERALFEKALAQMGSAGYILMDTLDELELVEGGGSGAGFKIYESLEKRCEAKISKILLGHADALDSTSGKIGASQGEDSPVTRALEDIQTVDSRFLESNVNTELLPRLRELGLNIPDDLHFEIKNDQEREEMRRREDESNKLTADIAQVMKNAGLQMDAEYFEERTGIPTKAAPIQPQAELSKVQNRLRELYK